MRNLCVLPVSLGVLVSVLICSAQAGTTFQCLENALPMETLGDDAEQRDTLLSQAEACMREAKPLRAVALLSQLIKTNPTDAASTSTAAAPTQQPGISVPQLVTSA
jgi:uncharacterized MAPEG superfamily protein